MQGIHEHWDWSMIRKRCVIEAMRILRRQQDADEAVQEALARAWRSRASCRTPDAPLPWCLQITRNEAFRVIRRRQAQACDPLDEIAVEDARARREQPRTLIRIDVSRALGTLEPHERHLIALRYMCDYSHAEIAEQFDIPEATARVRLHRARKRLASLL
jgi:RNA polymerase sigma-70 factor (ECF subfamily)